MRTQTIRLGTCAWSFDDWKGAFLPANTSDLLVEYARHFDTVEIDSSFHYCPARKTAESWRKRVPGDFRFAAKAPRTITHLKALHNCQAELNEFLENMSALEEKLGPILFQFPPHWNALQGREALRQFLPQLPSGWKFAVEFRNRTWFEERTADLLSAYNVAWNYSDFGNFWTGPEQPPIFITSDFAYIRFRGSERDAPPPFTALHLDRSFEEQKWAEAISDMPVDNVWAYFSNGWAGLAPASVNGFKERLGIPIRHDLPGGQGTLF